MNINMKKIVNLLIILLAFILMFSTISFASMADWSDEEADKQTEEELKEQKDQDAQAVGKSSNNFLASLSIEGYVLTPKFDKQTINYTIDAKVGDIVNIEATAEDSRAEVLGTGKVKIIDDKEPIEITVKAENGIERTYFIDTSNGKNTSSNSITNEEVKEYNAETTSKSVEMKENEKNNLIIIIVIAIVVLLLLFVAFPKKKKKSKRR